jgi:hypothetical protein
MNSRLQKSTVADIRTHGRSVIMVFDGDPPFAYTIGNWTRQLPELLVIGGCNPPIGIALNVASDLQRDRSKPFAHGEVVHLEGARFPVKFVNASVPCVKDEYTIQAGQYFGHEDYQVRQMLLPDGKGRFPDDPACDAPFSHQPRHWMQ